MVGVCTALAIQGGTNALTLVTLRALATLVILFGFYRLTGVSLALSPRERRLATAIAVPLCINTWCLNEAIAQMPLPLAVLIFYLWPAIVAVVSWIGGAEPFRWRGALGLAAAFVGLALVLSADPGAARTAGALFALVSAFAWSAVFLLTHRFFRGRDTRPVIIHTTVMTLIFFTVAVLATGAWRVPSLPVGWVGVAGVTLFYALGTIGIFAATTSVGPMRTGFFMNFEPVATVLLSAIVLGQRLSPIQLAGAALVIAALFVFRPPPRTR